MTEGVSGECLLAVSPDRSNEIVQGQILSFIDSVASPANAFIFTLRVMTLLSTKYLMLLSATALCLCIDKKHIKTVLVLFTHFKIF